MGPYILQSIAVKMGFKAEVLCLNQLLAATIGIKTYESVSYGQPFRMLGERLFARSAYGLPPLGKSPELCLDPARSVFGSDEAVNDFEYKYYDINDFDLEKFIEIEAVCYGFVKEVARAIKTLDCKMVLLSSNWEQTNCCVALMNAVKKDRPETLTLLGGCNCEGEMAEGIAALSDAVDFVFSGESETTFKNFLENYTKGEFPDRRIIVGDPVMDLDAIPLPDYQSYFDQMQTFFGDRPPKGITLSYEATRGCAWGKCRFCGMNGKRAAFRQKNRQKVAQELESLVTTYPDYPVLFVDKMLPADLCKDLLPLLGSRSIAASKTCELRSDYTLQELIDLKQTHIKVIKPGIEAFSARLLKSINKGATVGQNILLLRNAAALGLYVSYNLLWGFPNDRITDYEETFELLPLLYHLNPPDVFRHLSLDRFCTYFEHPESHNIRNLRPWAVYEMVYPDHTDVRRSAYRFIGDYPSGAHDCPELIRKIAAAVTEWKSSWKNSYLVMKPFADQFLVADTRPVSGKNKHHILDFDTAREIMLPEIFRATEAQSWSLKERLGIAVDDRYIPLVTAAQTLLLQFEAEADHDDWLKLPTTKDENPRARTSGDFHIK